jgi:RimJ/RimL family protein N-acetyltransferase
VPYGLGVAELSFPVPALRDAVVSLRPWRESDVPAKLMAFGDPVVQRFSWSRAAPYTEADAGAYFVEQQQARLRGQELNFALVEPANDDVVLGGGSLYDVDLEQSRAAVGYWLAPAARGRGVATHAVRLVARWAFSELGLARLELTCGPDNEASQRVAAGAGSCGRAYCARTSRSRVAAGTRWSSACYHTSSGSSPCGSNSRTAVSWL